MPSLLAAKQVHGGRKTYGRCGIYRDSSGTCLRSKLASVSSGMVYKLIRWIAHEHATHAARLRMELAQSKREQRHYLKQVELGKSQEKRKRKREKEEATGKSEPKPLVAESAGKRQKVDERRDSYSRKGHGRDDGKDVVRDKRREGDLDKVLGSIF